jgi:hypothetical protein
VDVNWDSSPEFYFSHHSGFDLRDEACIHALEDQIKRINPKLVVLDPFYRMARGVDENSAKEVGAVLSPLLDLKNAYGVGILLIHHWHKANVQNPRSGHERISGSGVFGRWFESAVYAERTDEDPFTVTLTAEHRKHVPQGLIHVRFDLTDGYVAEVRVPREEGAEEYDDVQKLLDMMPPEGMLLTAFAEELGLKRLAAKRKAVAKGATVGPGEKVGPRGSPPLIVKRSQ